MSFHVPYQGEGHGMSSHVSGGWRARGNPGGTWDELPYERGWRAGDHPGGGHGTSWGEESGRLPRGDMG